MLPTAGLYLPETLHRRHAPEKPETRGTDRKYFDRKPRIFDRKSFDRRPATLARKSMDDAHTNSITSFSSLPTVFNFIDFAISQEDVSSDNKVFVNLIHRVRHDVNEALRLRACPAVVNYCESVPDKETWIDAILLDVKRALNDIGVYMENVRVSVDGGGVAVLKRKFEWVLGHHQKLATRQISLSTCHQSLMAAISLMQQVELSNDQGSYELERTTPDWLEEPDRPWMQGEGGSIMRSPYSRQKWRLSHRNMSLPSIMVSEPEGLEPAVQSVNDIPVELPGSTPHDLADPDNWDLYAPPLKPMRSYEQIRPQTSMDQLQPSLSLDETQTRKSLDLMRPRALSEQIRPRSSREQIRPRPSFEEYKARPSFDQISPLPILNESRVDLIDRTDSNASINKAATIPLAAKRYRAKPVNVRNKGPIKNRSATLDTQLPYIPAHSSLIMELSRWVLPSAKGSDESTDMDTPSTSVASSPVAPSSPPSIPESRYAVLPSVRSMVTASAFPTPMSTANILPLQIVSSPLEYSADSFTAHQSTGSLRTDSNSPAREVIPVCQSPTSSNMQKSPPTSIRSIRPFNRKRIRSATSSSIERQTRSESVNDTSLPPEIAALHKHAEEPTEVRSEGSDPVGSTTSERPPPAKPPVATVLEWALGVKAPTIQPLSPLSPLEYRVTNSISRSPTANHAKEPASLADTRPVISVENKLEARPPVAKTPEPTSPGASSPVPTIPFATGPAASLSSAIVPVADVPKPLIGQSKRRAAHARRMQLAYGTAGE
ncbi:hypothetical protein K504DRAFT_187544 [Pleomassaria siparia CBS 279.74]|uniref:Uncharacterized protein n=1 Tax=Pleomassaria siparia CBS 279.74 TaxID=1314801 RepID=A0A6G1JR39_9PLEO|nr:hypothetical protein K504DRAFT_187544 [Pleomassaria siparia CBS 279.74]